MKVWIDGIICDAEDARLPVLDHGLLYGDGVFEGIAVRHRRVFRLSRHLDERLRVSAAAIGLALPVHRSTLVDIVTSVGRAIGGEAAYLRLVLTRGVGPLGVDPARCPTPGLFCIGGALSLYDAATRDTGLSLCTVTLRRDPAGALDPEVKSLNYLVSVMAKREANLRGADEALLLNPHGAVAEAAVGNLFVVQDGVLRTPPCSDGALPGITRATILELADALGVPQRVETVRPLDFLRADEAFMSGTGAGLVPVASLDGAPVGTGERPVFDALAQAYVERTRWDGVALDQPAELARAAP